MKAYVAVQRLRAAGRYKVSVMKAHAQLLWVCGSHWFKLNTIYERPHIDSVLWVFVCRTVSLYQNVRSMLQSFVCSFSTGSRNTPTLRKCARTNRNCQVPSWSGARALTTAFLPLVMIFDYCFARYSSNWRLFPNFCFVPAETEITAEGFLPFWRLWSQIHDC